MSKLLNISLGFLVFISFFNCTIKAQSFDRKYTKQARIGLSVSNIGIIGNAFDRDYQTNGFPSGEFPVGSGNETLFEASPWVGGIINGTQVAVSTGAYDSPSGYSTGGAGYEFTAAVGSKILERSSLTDNALYNRSAVSHQDFISDFTDRNTQIPGTSISISDHTNPLGLSFHSEVYNWNYEFADFFVPINLTIKNVGVNTIDSLFLGYWANFVVRNVNITPPSGTAFFNKGGSGFLDSLYMSYQFDAVGDTPITNTYVALRFLGATDKYGFHSPALDPKFKCNYNVWQFRNAGDPVYFTPTNDAAKFSKMASGLNTRPNWNTVLRSQIKAAGNRTNLLSVGPFKPFLPGDSITISFAYICAPKNEDKRPTSEDNDNQKQTLLKNAGWAQTAFNGNDKNGNGLVEPSENIYGNGILKRWLLPSPPNTPKYKIVVKDNMAELYWANNAEFSVDPVSNKRDFAGYRIYQTDIEYDIKKPVDIKKSLKLIESFDLAGDGLFFETGFNKIKLATNATFEGDTTRYHYKYTFKNLANGWQHGIALTAFDAGDPENDVGSLETSNLSTVKYIFPGKEANADLQKNEPFVYPNPYYGGASWEGQIRLEEERKVYFSNLPKNAEIRIYTQSGDLINKINHDPSFIGGGLRWYTTYSDAEKIQTSGGEHAWNLLSADSQIIAAGVYTFTVLDKDSGKAYTGQFAVIR